MVYFINMACYMNNKAVDLRLLALSKIRDPKSQETLPNTVS